MEGSLHRGTGLSARWPSCYALCACGWVAWLCAASSGCPRALQEAEMPPGALPGSAAMAQSWPGLCPATWYGRTIPQPEGPHRQPARHDGHMLWEHLCAGVQTLPLLRAPSTRAQQRWGKKLLKSPGPTVQAASFAAAHTPKRSVTLHPAPRAREVKLHAASKAELAGLFILHFPASLLKQRQPTRSSRTV